MCSEFHVILLAWDVRISAQVLSLDALGHVVWCLHLVDFVLLPHMNRYFFELCVLIISSLQYVVTITVCV